MREIFTITGIIFQMTHTAAVYGANICGEMRYLLYEIVTGLAGEPLGAIVGPQCSVVAGYGPPCTMALQTSTPVGKAFMMSRPALNCKTSNSCWA